MTKITIKIKRLQLQGGIGEIRIKYVLGKNIITIEFLIMADIFFDISPRTGKISVKTDTDQLDIFANKVSVI